jgi:hypothetical protein
MKRIIGLVSTITALVQLAGTLPGDAQQPPQDMVPFKATVQGPARDPFAVIPGNPPVAVGIQIETGQADFLGQVTYTDLEPIVLGADGKPLGIDHGIGALTAANGDAIYFSFHGVCGITGTQGACEEVFIVTGGKGRFAGATGGGIMRGQADLAKGTHSWSIEATISRPKP